MWKQEMIAILRALIFDMDDDPEYCDSRLEKILIVAARYVANELDFSYDYDCNVLTSSISPDPIENGDDNFVNLVCLKAACMVDRGTANLAAGEAVRVKDGPSEVDFRELWKARIALMEKGICKAYEEAKKDYQTTNSGYVVGAAILAPFKLYANYSYPYRYGRG